MQEIEDAVWKAADRLRGSVDAMDLPEYVGGLIFLKYVSDAFEEHRAELRARLVAEGYDEDRVEDLLEDREFSDTPAIWVPMTARWLWINARKNTRHIGEVIDDAMNAIMLVNPSLLGALPTVFRDGTADHGRLAEVVALIGRVRFDSTREKPARDALAEAYEYLLDMLGGDSRTPRCVSRLMVRILEPYVGRVYDPACGSGGLLAEAGRFIGEYRSYATDSAVYGQEINSRAWRLARMSLAAYGIEHDLGARWGDTLADDEHPDLKAHFVMAQPPFSQSDWARDEEDPRWIYGVPPLGNANYAWLQHSVSKLSERGAAALVLATGSLVAGSSRERRIRQELVEADLVAAIVGLPGQLFHSTKRPACLWILTKRKSADRRGEILFIDAHDMGTMVMDPKRSLRRVLIDEDLAKITSAYHAWRGRSRGRRRMTYRDDPGFCCSARLQTVREHDYDLTPARYVGSVESLARTRALTKDLYGVFN